MKPACSDLHNKNMINMQVHGDISKVCEFGI
jgi:hypothetical protein